ncbi:MAG: type II toxin-antitoxin system RelB/DinJ family antitoxin [Oscillospiraceae bacterium]|nr:type II toxin-antitoxin system RelB/DinJ family antitoxin [Oscillospiraceae bacterium]
MAETNINIRIDEGLKQNFDNLCNDLGLTITTAITIFAKTAVRQQKIPFEISLDIPNAETIEAIKEVQEMKKNPSLGKTYTNVEEMIKEVLSDV